MDTQNETLHTANMEGQSLTQYPALSKQGYDRQQEEINASPHEIQDIIAEVQNVAKSYTQHDKAEGTAAETLPQEAEKSLKVFGIAAFLGLRIPPRRHLLYPIIPE